MKKNLLYASIFLITCLLFSCNPSANKKTKTAMREVSKSDSIKEMEELIGEQKMEGKADEFITSGSFDSALGTYKRCIYILITILKQTHNRTFGPCAGEIALINSWMVDVYDTMHLSDSAAQHAIEAYKWMKLSGDSGNIFSLQLSAAYFLKKLGMTKKDTAEKGQLCRQALQYALLAHTRIHSPQMKDTMYARANFYDITGGIYKELGYKILAKDYQKTAHDLYAKAKQQQPE